MENQKEEVKRKTLAKWYKNPTFIEDDEELGDTKSKILNTIARKTLGATRNQYEKNYWAEICEDIFMKKCKRARNTISNCIVELEKDGYIQVEKCGTKTGRYRIHPNKLDYVEIEERIEYENVIDLVEAKLGKMNYELETLKKQLHETNSINEALLFEIRKLLSTTSNELKTTSNEMVVSNNVSNDVVCESIEVDCKNEKTTSNELKTTSNEMVVSNNENKNLEVSEEKNEKTTSNELKTTTPIEHTKREGIEGTESFPSTNNNQVDSNLPSVPSEPTEENPSDFISDELPKKEEVKINRNNSINTEKEDSLNKETEMEINNNSSTVEPDFQTKISSIVINNFDKLIKMRDDKSLSEIKIKNLFNFIEIIKTNKPQIKELNINTPQKVIDTFSGKKDLFAQYGDFILDTVLTYKIESLEELSVISFIQYEADFNSNISNTTKNKTAETIISNQNEETEELEAGLKDFDFNELSMGIESIA